MPQCPRCHSPLSKRVNRKTGEPFYGCTAYPKCTHTEPYYVEISRAACKSQELQCIVCPLRGKPQCYMLKDF